jgi:hypothetical protein
MRTKGWFLPLLVALGASQGGCFISANDPPPDRVTVIEPTNPASTLTVRWTIAGKTDPAQCQQSVSPTFQVRVIDTSGREIGAWQQTCTAFATSITLNPGTYTARALLLDEAQRPRTTEVSIERFTLVGGDELITDVDFPSDSFRDSLH